MGGLGKSGHPDRVRAFGLQGRELEGEERSPVQGHRCQQGWTVAGIGADQDALGQTSKT